jgi:hypothetical protein
LAAAATLLTARFARFATVVFLAVDLLAVDFLAAVRLVVDLRAVAFLAAAVRLAGDFFVARADVVFRVELVAASVVLAVASSSLAGTCASCCQDV